MNNEFDELTRRMAQSVSRRAALKKFGGGLAGMALACFGLTNRAEAAKVRFCATDANCDKGQVCRYGLCFKSCSSDRDCGPHGVCQFGACGA